MILSKIPLLSSINLNTPIPTQTYGPPSHPTHTPPPPTPTQPHHPHHPTTTPTTTPTPPHHHHHHQQQSHKTRPVMTFHSITSSCKPEEKLGPSIAYGALTTTWTRIELHRKELCNIHIYLSLYKSKIININNRKECNTLLLLNTVVPLHAPIVYYEWITLVQVLVQYR